MTITITDKNGKPMKVSYPFTMIFQNAYQKEMGKKGSTPKSAHEAGLAALERVDRAYENALKNPN